MKHKTNLFYNIGIDSKFLTFSNYTDALTGNFLSTNTKLFPSKFLCLNIPKLNTADPDYSNIKKSFIENVLISKYENKMASINTNFDDKTKFVPLKYLLEYLYEFDDSLTVPYVGEITENDYNGTFTDTLCIIDSYNVYKGQINKSTSGEITLVKSESDLFGWYDGQDSTYTGPSVYSSLKPSFDTENEEYIINSNLTVEYIKDDESSEITFNVLIPLFDMIYTDSPCSEFVSLNDATTLNDNYNTNVPLGIWFADSDIIIKRDKTYAQSWTLEISSQFKPFPSSSKIESDISKTCTANAFNTYAQLMVAQNEIVGSIETLKEKIADLNKQLLIVNNSSDFYVEGEKLILKKYSTK